MELKCHDCYEIYTPLEDDKANCPKCKAPGGVEVKKVEEIVVNEPIEIPIATIPIAPAPIPIATAPKINEQVP